MNSAKRKAVVFLLFMCCFMFSGCGILDDSESAEDIFQYVTEHVEDLQHFPYDAYRNLRGDDEEKRQFIKGHLGEDTIVKAVYRYNPDILQFYCGGTGIVTGSTYSGFYYSEKDTPYAFEFEKEAALMQTKNGVYEWKSEDGERQIVTERIQPNWFSYYQRWD